MKYTSIFDIMGPIMVGPSSSHTAGAVRIGKMAKNIYEQPPKKIKFILYNSFAKTGKGHGTDKGLLAGVLGFKVDDTRIKEIEKIALENDISYTFEAQEDLSKHPNAVDIIFSSPEKMKISACSLGAGEIKINAINDFEVDIRGDLPTLLLVYKDQPGVIWKAAKAIQEANVNIATLNCTRTAKGQEATMTICLDSILPQKTIQEIKKIPDMYVVRNIQGLDC